MKFKVKSAYFDCDYEDWVKVMETVCTREDNDFYLDVDTLPELKTKLKELTEKYEKLANDHNCFKLNNEVVIWFEHMTIVLYDYYME